MAEPLPPLREILRDGFGLIGRLVRAHPVAFSLAVLGASAFALAIVAAALVIGWVTDNVIIPVLEEGEPLGDLWVAAVAAVLGVAVFKGAAIILRRTAATWLQFRSQADLRFRLIAHQLKLKLSWFNRQATGDLLAVSETDARQATFILAPLPFATGGTLLLVVSVVIIFVLDPILGAIALASLVTTISIDVYGMWRIFHRFQAVQERRGVVSRIAHESFDGALTVKALGREEYETERLRVASDGLRDSLITVEKIWAFYRMFVESLPTATILVILVIGAIEIDAGSLTTGELVTIAYLLTLVNWPIRIIAFVLWDIAESLAGWRRVEAVLDVEEFVDYGTLVAVSEASGAMVAGNEVNFAYRPEEVVLGGVEWDIPAGRTVAVVGPTGSGKSTLAMLLARLWDPGTGKIHLDGRDLRQFARSELPREVAFVAQEAFLFDDDVTGNITMGSDISKVDVETAVELAGAEGFIHELPHGFSTQIGERGTSLSGGERQRLALARALARKPRLLILDDATSAVDASVEGEILRGLRRAELPSTVLIVAHRRSSIMLADEVVFLDGGRIIGHGSHAELLASVPGYARLLEAYDEDAERRAGERRGEEVSA